MGRELVESERGESGEGSRGLFPWQRLVWPGIIFYMLGGQILLTLSTVYMATRSRSFAVEPDYYQKALHWDDTAAGRQMLARLGWKISIEVAPEVSPLGERTFTCRLSDKSGKPVAGARIDVVAFAHAVASQRVSAVLEPGEPGAYTGRVRMRHKGLWEFRMAIRQGDVAFTSVQQCRL